MQFTTCTTRKPLFHDPYGSYDSYKSTDAIYDSYQVVYIGQPSKKTPQVDREVADPAASSSSDHTSSDAESDQGISASRLKMRPENSEDNSRNVSDGETNLQGEG